MRSTHKRGLGFLLSAALVVGLSPLPALADTPDATAPTEGAVAEEVAAEAEKPGPEEELVFTAASDSITQMELDEDLRVNLDGDGYWIGSFTAPQDGTFVFTSFDRDGDPVAELYGNAELTNQLDDDDEGNGNNNFRIIYEMQEGETVYLKAFDYSGSMASYSVVVSALDTKNLSFGKIRLSNVSYDITEGLSSFDYDVYDAEDNRLTEGTDFELVYYVYDDDANEYETLEAFPDELGEYYVSARGIGDYTGETDKNSFRLIDPHDFSSFNFWLGGYSFDLSAGDYDLGATLADPEFNYLTEGTDYELVYFDRNENELDEKPSTAGSYYVAARPADGSPYTGMTHMERFTLSNGNQGTQTMVLGESYDSFVVSGESWIGSFTAEQAGKYVFTATGSTDVSGSLYEDEELTNQLEWGDPTYNGVAASYTLGEGETVYFYVYTWDDADLTMSVALYDPYDLTFGSLYFRGTSQYAATGEPVVPKVIVHDADYNTLSTACYDLAYYDNNTGTELDSAPVNAGEYGVKAIGKGDYHGETTYSSFTIVAANDLSIAKFVLSKTSFEETGNPVDLSEYLSITAADGTKLVEGTHYELSYYYYETDEETDVTPSEVGDYEVYARGIEAAGYTGVATNYFNIYDPYNISDGHWRGSFFPSSKVVTTKDGLTLPKPVFCAYDDETEEVTNRLTEGTDFQLSHFTDKRGRTIDQPTSDGTYHAVYEGIGSYSGQRSIKFTLTDGLSLDSCTIELKDYTLDYAGDPLEPEVRIVDKSGNWLVEGTDYQLVGYRDDETGEYVSGTPSEVGDYTAVYEGIGAYHGEMEEHFRITDGFDLAHAYLAAGDEETFMETGSPVDLAVRVLSENDKRLTEGVDYELVYGEEQEDEFGGVTYVELSEAPSEAGAYYLLARAKGDTYRGETSRFCFNIVPQNGGAIDLALDAATDATIPERGQWLGRFVAPEDGLYTFAVSNASGDPYAELYEDSALTESIDYNDGINFSLTHALKKGDALYLRVKDYSGGEETCSVKVSKASDKDLSFGSVKSDDWCYAYAGNPITPTITVRDGLGNIVDASNYELFYEVEDEYEEGYLPTTSVAIKGYYRVKAVAKGGTYTGSTRYSYFDVVDNARLGNADISLKSSREAYTGSEIKPVATVTDASGKELVEGTDYELTYTASIDGVYSPTGTPKNIGSYHVVAKGKGSYTGNTYYKSFTIYNSKDLSARGTLTLQGKVYNDDDLPVFSLNGSPVEPEVIVKVKGQDEPLVKGTDYTVAYANNTAATSYGTPATVTVTGKGAYTGTLTKRFAITSALDLDLWFSSNGANVTMGDLYDHVSRPSDEISYLYTGGDIKPQVQFATDASDTTAPVEGTDYTVSYVDVKGQTVTPRNKGSYDILLTAKGSTFTGKTKIPFRIGNDKDIYSAHIKRETTINGKTLTANGGDAGFYLEGTADTLGNLVWSLFDGAKQLVEGVDYTVQMIRDDALNLFSYLFSGLGNYSGSVRNNVYLVESHQVSLASAKVTVPNVTYNGKAQTPTVGVAVDGTALKAGTDYTVAYANNVNAGTATVTVAGKGGYAGTAKASFKIAKADNTLTAKAGKPSVKASKVKKKAQKLAVGKVVKVSGAYGAVTYKKASGNKKITVAKNGKVTIKKGLKKGTYKVKINVTAAGNANYNAATKQVTVKIKVK